MASVSYCPSCLTTFRGDDTPGCPNLSCGEPRPSMGWGLVLQPGDHIDRHYLVDRVLAVGGAGLTYKARALDDQGQPSGPFLAVKVLYSVRASGAYLQRLATEAQILQELAHENIVQCRGFVHRVGHEPYLVTLFEDGGSLAQFVKRRGPLPVELAAGLLKQILLGLDTAHQRGVVHRDLKPDNVLLSAEVDDQQTPHVRVADFGIAKVAGGLNARITKLGAFVGTPEYAAPEQFEQQGSTAATDIFACGGLLYFMVTSRPPITLSHRSDIEASYDELLSQLPPAVARADTAGIDDFELAGVNQILFHTMAARAEHRWTAHQVIAALNPLIGLGEPTGGSTLELTRDPAPRRSLVPLDSQSVPLAERKVDRGETSPFLISPNAEEEAETEPGAPARVAELLGDEPPEPAVKAEGKPAEEPDSEADSGAALAVGAAVAGAALMGALAAGAAVAAAVGASSTPDKAPAKAEIPPKGPTPPTPATPATPATPPAPESKAAPPTPKAAATAPKVAAPTPKVTAPAKAIAPTPAPRRGRTLVRLLAFALFALFAVGAVGGLLSMAGVLVVGGIAWDGANDDRPDDGVEIPDPRLAGKVYGRDRQRLQGAVQAKLEGVGKRCRAEGSVVLSVRVAADGSLSKVSLDPYFVQSEAAALCVVKEVEAVRVKKAEAGEARLALVL